MPLQFVDNKFDLFWLKRTDGLSVELIAIMESNQLMIFSRIIYIQNLN